MIVRRLAAVVATSLDSFPVVALLGARQVGKTTLASTLCKGGRGPCVYLDLERESARRKLADPELYLQGQAGKLVVLDEVQRLPDLFPLLRSLVDERIRDGDRAGHFLVLGSASRDLLRQSSESLAGRISYLELDPFSLPEVAGDDPAAAADRLWLRGGLPGSYLAKSEAVSWEWRGNFVTTYLERDIPQLGPRLPAEQMRRLWTMLAHGQGDMLNLSRLAASLGVSGKTVHHYLDVLTDLYMVRQLPPWSGNTRKRLVRSPKVYVRDTGLLHRLAKIPDMETLLGHPLCGPSWEGFVLEQILNGLPDVWDATFYRTSAGAEIDLVLEGAGGEVIAIEIKRSLSPRLSKGYTLGFQDVGATRGYVVVPQGESYPLTSTTEVVSLASLLQCIGGAASPASG